MGIDEQHTLDNFRSFGRQFVVVLKDLRLWAVVIPSLLLSGLVLSFLGPRLAAVATFAIGLIASYVLRQVEKLPALGELSLPNNSYERFLIPVLVGILIVPSAEMFSRLWMMPWYWFHTSKDIPSCKFLMGAIACDWTGFLFIGVVVAILTRQRATFAAMVGIAVYMPLTFTDMFRGNLAQSAYSLLASSCKMETGGPDSSDFQEFRYGLASGLVLRALLVIFTASLVSSWRASRRTTVPQ